MSRMPNKRHLLSLSFSSSKVPRITLDCRGGRRDFRVERHAPRREGRSLAERRVRRQETEPPNPEKRRAQRDAHLPRAAILRTVAVLHSAAAMPNASRYAAA